MIYLGYLMCILKEFIFWSQVECSININLFYLDDRVSIFLFTFYCSCSIGLSITDGVLKSPIIIMDLSISPFSSVIFASLLLKFFVECIHFKDCSISLMNCPFYRYEKCSSLSPAILLIHKSTLSDIDIATFLMSSVESYVVF